MPSSHIFAVPAGLPFLKICVRALLNNQLIAGADMGDPAQLADIQIFAPSRRAARLLRSAFVEESANKASFLPPIRPLGEAEDSDFLSFSAAYESGAAPENAAEAEDLLAKPSSIAPLERQALLARLIRPWREKLPAHIRALFGRETIEVPSNTADALWLARNLASLMDEMETEGADSAAIKNIAPEDLAEWWQVTTEFLDLALTAWPDILAERGQTTAAAARNAALRHEGKLLADERSEAKRENGKRLSNSNKPVLVFGSTGSVPAAAELIKLIAARPNSAVVLPGLDRDLDDKAWDSLDSDPHNPALFTHPQFMLKRLLTRLNIVRGDVIFLGAQIAAQKAREKAVSEIFRPAASTEEWRKLREVRSAESGGESDAEPNLGENSFSHISLIEAATAREEALSLAAALRAALEEPGKTAALITNDRVLARRVCAELARFGAEANDSGGAPLSETEPLTMLRLLMACLFSPGDSVALLALLKHPLTRLGFARADLRRQVEQFEFFALRGGAGRINIGEAELFMAERLQKLTELENAGNAAVPAACLEEIMGLARCLTAAAGPLYRFAAGTEPVNFAQAVIATVETLENFGRDERKNLQRLYAQEQGQSLIRFFRKLLADRSGLTFMPREWPQILDALMADEAVEMRQSGHPRLFILGLFEARLQHFDTVLIGGLNEGSLPHNPQNSPFMSRQMKAAIGLPPPEQKIGFTAHDMAQAFAAPKVILSRALRVDNAPSVASRWLRRLQTVAGDAANAAMRARGDFYLRAAQNLDNAPNEPFAPRPCPKPPLALRPKKFGITEIETLRRDPYAIYARYILKLKPLEPLIADADAAERGTLFHAILAAFSQFYPRENIAPIKEQALKQLRLIAEAELAKLQLPPDIAVLWRPRLLSLLPNYLDWEAGLSQRRRFAEIHAENTEIDGTDCVIRGRADRIDILAEQDESGAKAAEIMDFKTGSSPDKKYARLLAAPQLALEGALLARGSFKDSGKAVADKLYYIRLKPDGAVRPEDIAEVKAGGADKDAQSLSEEAWRRLVSLIRHFQKAETGYLSRALPSLGDYDHLARVSEWSNAEGESGEGE